MATKNTTPAKQCGKGKCGCATPPPAEPKLPNTWADVGDGDIEKYIDLAVLAGYTCGCGEAAALFTRSQAMGTEAGIRQNLTWDAGAIKAAIHRHVDRFSATPETREAVVERIKDYMARAMSCVAEAVKATTEQ